MKNLIIYLFLASVVILPRKLSAQAKMDSLNALLKTTKEDTNKVNILYQLSEECDEEDILKYAELSLKLAEKLNYKKGVASSLHSIGRVYFALKKYKEAEYYTRRSLNLSKELNYPLIIRGASLLLKSIYKATDKYKESLDMYQLYIATNDSLNVVETQKAMIEKQKEPVEERNVIVLSKQKEILDSIHYAKRIQTALITLELYIERTLTKLIKD